MLLGATTGTMLTQMSSLLINLRHIIQNNTLLATYLGKKESFWKQKLKKLQEQKVRRKRRSVWYKKGRTDKWWENILMGILPEDEWKKNFRMSRETFEDLVQELSPWISPKPDSPNYRAILANKKVAITLYYLKDTGSLSMTANTFGIHISTVSKVIKEVCSAITYNLGPIYVQLPKTEEEMIEKAAQFEAKYGMHQAFGCIDGTHVPILRPIEHSQDYFCYKQYFSLNVQAVCDFRGIFMDVDCRWPGSVHDAKVFANSGIGNKLRNEELPITYQEILTGKCKVPNYLIGDPAYPLTPYCIKEYDNCSTNSKVIFNNLLRSARNPVECAFGRLKARWSFLSKNFDLSLDFVPVAIYACFVLHNYCEINKCVIDPELVKTQVNKHKLEKSNPNFSPDPIFSGNLDEGAAVRDTIKSYIENVLYKN